LLLDIRFPEFQALIEAGRYQADLDTTEDRIRAVQDGSLVFAAFTEKRPAWLSKKADIAKLGLDVTREKMPGKSQKLWVVRRSDNTDLDLQRAVELWAKCEQAKRCGPYQMHQHRYGQLAISTAHTRLNTCPLIYVR